MKEFIHKIRQILTSTRVIENSAKYYFLCVGCVLIHFIFTVLFFVSRIYFLSIFNLVATLFYVFLGVVYIPKEKFKLLFILAFIEVEINATVSSIMLGQGYDFMIYTLSLIPGSFYLVHTWPEESKNKYGYSLISINSALLVGFMYVVVDVLYAVIPPVYDSSGIAGFKIAFHYFNILISVSLLLAFSILFGLEVRYTQKLLNDENSRLDEIASRDPLTKALNRRSFHNILKDNIAKDDSHEFALIMLDIDDFKRVNDTYGHVMGDQVLTRIASVMEEIIREEDSFCRWGGEEFLILIHGGADEYDNVAERIRKRIEELVFHFEGNAFKVTVTLGISEYQQGLQLRTLVDMADQKLYYGKSHGKNQVVK